MKRYALSLMAICAACAMTRPGPTAPATQPTPSPAAEAAVDVPPARTMAPAVETAPVPPAVPSVVPPRIGLMLPVPKGGDRPSVLLGAVLVLGNRGLKIRMDACGGKEWAWESWATLPLVDVPCECTIENYRTEGCFAVKWIEVVPPSEAPLPKKEAR